MTIGTVTPDQLKIVTSQAVSNPYCNDTVATFSGTAYYKLLDGEESCFDYPVKEGDVTYKLIRSSDSEIISSGNVKTNIYGNWSFQVYLPDDEGAGYEMHIQVTDHTLVEIFDSAFTLIYCPPPIYPPPSGGGSGGGGSGGSGPGDGQPLELFNAWVYSADIQFSKENPALGETITISGIVHANNSYSGLPVTWKATYLSGGTVDIAPTAYFEMNGDLFVSTPMATSKSPTCGRVKIPHPPGSRTSLTLVYFLS